MNISKYVKYIFIALILLVSLVWVILRNSLPVMIYNKSNEEICIDNVKFYLFSYMENSQIIKNSTDSFWNFLDFLWIFCG